VSPRATTLLLLIAGAAAPPEPETDPFLAAMAGKSGPDAVAAPSFDPDEAASFWTLRPRREIVDALAARLLRGEAKSWFAKQAAVPVPAPIADRFPPGFEAGEFTVSDRLAARVPADAAAVFFGSLDEAETAVEELARFLPMALPAVFADAPGGRRDALDRAVAKLLVPTIWRSNPAVRRGTRQAALLAADPDLRWNPEIALVVEVDDASLVRFHRLSTLSFEDRGARRLRVDGLDAISDDGSVRSFFGLEGGIAVWSTGKSFRDRILAASAGKVPTLLSPDPRAYALARRTFPAADGGPLLVIPDGFLERANSASVRGRRAAALRCDAVRRVVGARALAKTAAPLAAGVRLECPAGGGIQVAAASAEVSCAVHGSILHPVPIGDLPDGAGGLGGAGGDLVVIAGIPVAGRWGGSSFDVLVPPGAPGIGLLGIVSPEPQKETPEPRKDFVFDGDEIVLGLLNRIRAAGFQEEKAVAAYSSQFGVSPVSVRGQSIGWRDGTAEWSGPARAVVHLVTRPTLPSRDGGGVLRIGTPTVREQKQWGSPLDMYTYPLEWR